MIDRSTLKQNVVKHHVLKILASCSVFNVPSCRTLSRTVAFYLGPAVLTTTRFNAQASGSFQLDPVGLSGLEPLTPALSAQCSNRLSYRPVFNG